MIHVLGHFNIDARVNVPENDLFKVTLELPVLSLLFLKRLLDRVHDDLPALDRLGVVSRRGKLVAKILTNAFVVDEFKDLIELRLVGENLLIRKVRLHPILLQDVGVRALEGRMHRRHFRHRAGASLALHRGEVFRHCRTRLIRQFSCALVAHPAVHTTTTGIHPQQVLESEIFPQARVQNLQCHRHERPTLAANVCLGATRTHVVVIRHIDIKHQFPLHRLQIHTHSLLWPAITHHSKLDARRLFFIHRLVKLLRVGEALIPRENLPSVILIQHEAKLSTTRVRLIHLVVFLIVSVRQPLEQHLRRIMSRVILSHVSPHDGSAQIPTLPFRLHLHRDVLLIVRLHGVDVIGRLRAFRLRLRRHRRRRLAPRETVARSIAISKIQRPPVARCRAIPRDDTDETSTRRGWNEKFERPASMGALAFAFVRRRPRASVCGSTRVARAM